MLTGKVALVTGAGRGIGKGCVLELARLGADVAINDRSHTGDAETAATEVRALGRRALIVYGDIAERAECEAAVERTVAEFGRIDVLVANAAKTVRKPFLELEEEDFRTTLNTTLLGAFHCAQFAARHMVRQGEGGSIIFMSSVHAVIPVRTSVPYNAAKAGLNHMARTIAAELAPHQIRVNVIEPGWTDTPGERAFLSDEQIQQGAKRLPFGRLATIEDIAQGAGYLASPASRYVTGTTLRIDGGLALLGQGQP